MKHNPRCKASIMYSATIACNEINIEQPLLPNHQHIGIAQESSRFLIAFDGLKQASESEGDTEEEPTPLAYVNFRCV